LSALKHAVQQPAAGMSRTKSCDRTIGGSAPGESVGKVDAEHGNATSAEGCVEGDQHLVVPSSPGAGSEDHGCRANEVTPTGHAISFS